jgi:DNA replication protein DnaC
MKKAEEKLKPISALWKKAAETLPKDEWECEVCHAVNTNWMADFFELNTNGKIVFKKGLCDNCRRLADEEIEKQDELIKQKNNKLKIVALLKASQIPPKVANTTFDDLEIRKGAELAFKTMKRIGNADRWVYVNGTNNTGKTLLVGATINHLASNGISCYYFNERALFKRLKDSMDRQNTESSYSIMKRLRDADIIFWDDFSVLPYSDWEMGTAYDILEFCDTYYKKVVFFSNVDLKEELKAKEDATKIRIGRRTLARMQKNEVYYITMKNKPFM